MSDKTNGSTLIGRRTLLRTTGATIAVAAFSGPAVAGLILPDTRTLSFRHVHTHEKLTATYWENGAIVPDACAAIDRILRDIRSGDIEKIDVRLLDRLFALRRDLRSKEAFEVYSGYRSPKTNAALRRRSRKVAKNSYHMRGMAIDVRLPGRSLRQVGRVALRQRSGGVGFYPKSNYLHLDVGPVRRW